MSLPEIVVWPGAVLPAQTIAFNPRPFTRGGGPSLGGIERVTRSDRGYWAGTLGSIVFRRATLARQLRVWNAIRVALGGRAGLVAVPVCSAILFARDGFSSFAPAISTHGDGTSFADGSGYAQDVVSLQMASLATIGATTVTLRLVNAPSVMSGVRFSYQHALYEVGREIAWPSADTVQVEVFPAIRAAIPADAALDADHPTCLCRLASDAEMDIETGVSIPRPTVSFVEAVDYWNDLAVAEGT